MIFLKQSTRDAAKGSLNCGIVLPSDTVLERLLPGFKQWRSWFSGR